LGAVPTPADLRSAYPEGYSEYNKHLSRRLRVLSKLLGLVGNGGGPSFFNTPLVAARRANQRALDVGAGSGIAASGLVEIGWTTTAVDFSLGSLIALGRKGTRGVRADASKLPFADSSFAFLVANNVLEHMYRPVACLREWRRVLSPGGQIAICVPNFDALDRGWFDANWHSLLSVPRHLVHFNRPALNLALELGGFSGVQVRSAPYPSVGGSVLQAMGIPGRRIRASAVLGSAVSLGTPVDFLSFAMGRGANLVATALA